MIPIFKSGFPANEKSFLYRNWPAGPDAYHLLPNYNQKSQPKPKPKPNPHLPEALTEAGEALKDVFLNGRPWLNEENRKEQTATSEVWNKMIKKKGEGQIV